MVLVVKDPSANAGDIKDLGSIAGSGRSSGGGHGNPLQYSCLENPMDRGAWRAAVDGVTKSQTKLKRLGMYTRTCLCPLVVSGKMPRKCESVKYLRHV